MTDKIEEKNRKARKKLAQFFQLKNKYFYKKKKPSSKKYPFDLIDPFSVFDDGSGYERFHLVGDNWLEKKSPKPIAMLWGFNDWKFGFTTDYLPEYRCAFAPRKFMGSRAAYAALRLKVKPSVFVVWGYSDSFHVSIIAKLFGVSIIRVEDAFIRSAELGASHSTPYSLVFDKTGLYYDAREPSDMENILNNYDFNKNNDLIANAERNIKTIIDLSLSKYNPSELNQTSLSGKTKTRKRIAVLGQVDSDASIRFGNPDNWTSEELIKLAKYENPAAEVIYRPHPEIYKGFQKSKFKKRRIEKFASIATPEEPFAHFLNTVDHVYTITSLTGFEALIRGAKVTCVGIPFYSGWGLTDDRARVERRTSTLSLEELFAGAYLLYPRYLADLNNSGVGLKAALLRINSDREIGLNGVCADTLARDFNSATLVAKTIYWPQIIFNHKDKLIGGLVSKLLGEINFSCLLKSEKGGVFYQTVVLFLISGALPDNPSRNAFIDNVRTYVEPGVLNELLLYLNRYFPGDYIAHHFSWLLVEHKEYQVSTCILEKQAGQIIESKKATSRVMADTLVGDAPVSEDSSAILGELSEVWMKILDRHIFDRNLDQAFELIKPLLLSNCSVPKLLRSCITLAELNFDYTSSAKISQFSQGIDLYDRNRAAVLSENRASKFIPINSKLDHLCLLSKILTLKADQIGAVQFNIELFPELFEDDTTVSVFEGMLSLDNDISTRKAQAYLTIDKPDKAVKIIENLIEAGDYSEMTRVLYSQALSYNGQLDKAFEVMKISRGLKLSLSSANIRESLRLCVLSSRYDLSLQLIDLAEKSRIDLGDMHKRKAYFGNRMLFEAFETFTEIQLVNTVAKYFRQKYYRFEEQLRCEESVLALAIFGPGDEIRFASIYNFLKDVLKTEDVSVSCSPRLLDLFSRSFPCLNFIPVNRPRNTDMIDLKNYSKVPGSDIIGVVDNNAVEAIEKSDRLLFVTDLLHRCLPEYRSFPGIAYLKADEHKVQEYCERLPKNTIIVGLSWRSSLTTHSRNEHYLTIEELEPLFSVPGVTFVNLQYDECNEELAWVEQRYPNKIVNFEDVDHYNDFDSVAALMKCMDLIISPATTVIELAGALGCPTWLFSNSSELDWRKIDAYGTDVWHNNTTIVEGQVLGDKVSLVETLYSQLLEYSKSKVVD